MKSSIVAIFLAFSLTTLLQGCSGSPARSVGMDSEEWANAVLRDRSATELCDIIESGCGSTRRGDPEWESGSYCKMRENAFALELDRRGKPTDYCENREVYDAQYAFEAAWESEVYNIDLLRVTTLTKRSTDYCARGGIHKIVVEGQISPDSSYAMSRLLERLKPCRSDSGLIIMPVTISLQSGGGLLDDGYAMGRTFRKAGVTTAVEDGEVCASSCAVALLGGAKRIVEDSGAVMYHAPYFSGENAYGKRDIDCDIGDEALNELNEYYRQMTDKETGDRLFERTMWYCSADDGWVVRGGSAAELYGIATEK